MNTILFLQTHMGLTLFMVGLLGLIFGSFFNVVISRYPAMLYRHWEQECREHLNMPEIKSENQDNLFSPPSRCPHCKTPIKAIHNIPILSYVFLGGKCASCHARISIQYPLVEALSAFLAIIMVMHFGISLKAFAAIIFSWLLIILSFIDLREQILPDDISLSFLWIGLILNAFAIFATPSSAILGAAIAYLFFWIVANLFKIIRKKDGMGYGDFKLFAGICAWLGVGALMNVLFIAVFCSLIISLFFLFIGKMSKDEPLPFGPFIALGGWLTLFCGPFIMNWLIPH